MSPIASALKFLTYLFTRRVHFPKDRIDEKIVLDDWPIWEIYRQVIVDPGKSQPQTSAAIFRPRFHIANMTHAQNQCFSLLPIPLFVGRRVSARSCGFTTTRPVTVQVIMSGIR